MKRDYEIIIGLEVHVELQTNSKIFCSCPTTYGAPPNTLCCPVCAGLPGALPTLNKEAVRLALIAGLALDCDISRCSEFDRKNYFYPDLPKAYQITQFRAPLCRNGGIEIELDGMKKRIGITQIHIEEDAGKLIHKGSKTLADLNRCGVPLIEIVSEPDLRSAEEAKAYLRELRAILLYTGVSDCKMNEGSMRCDVNLSVRERGESEFGTRTEIKNLNSIAFTGKAIEYEAARQIELISRGEKIERETLRFDASSGKTYPMRTKESARDYRYFPEPDLPPLMISKEEIDRTKHGLPKLPAERRKEYRELYEIGTKESEVLTSEKALAEYFEACAERTGEVRTLANLIIGDVLSLQSGESFECTIEPRALAKLAEMIGSERINSSTAKKLLREMWEKGSDPEEIAQRQGLWQINSESELIPTVREVIQKEAKAVNDYINGKSAAAKTIVGGVMKATRGRANPRIVSKIIEDILL